MNHIEGATRQKIRKREYAIAADDMMDNLLDVESGFEYIDALRDHDKLDETESYKRLDRILHSLSERALGSEYDRDPYPVLLISRAFKDGFLVGLEANRRLIGGDFDSTTERYVSKTIVSCIRASSDNVNKIAIMIRSRGAHSYHNNMAAINEKKAPQYNQLFNPLDEVVDEILDDLYGKADETQRSLFREGFGFVRSAQNEHQKAIDKEFYSIHSSIGSINTEQQ